ncbi:MAG: hypothetical protein M4D80_12920 [Myxococcota bacterium]|nr:hypothetical protein [Myxococcota bacterium]
MGCKTARPGMREGTAGPFDDLELTVSASQMVDGPLEVTAMLTRDSEECFVAPAGMRIVVDGQPLELASPGGKSRGQMISGVRVAFSTCNGAMFRAAQIEPRPRSQITVELGNLRAHMTVQNLLVTRVLRVLPSAQLRAGDRVTLEWTPASDEWGSGSTPTDVFIYHPNEVSVHPPVESKPPHFHFTMPAVRPGVAKIDLDAGREAHPKVLGCHGFERCRATAHTGPRDVDIVVLP